MIFNLNEGLEIENESSADMFDMNAVQEEVCNFDDPVLASTAIVLQAETQYTRFMEAVGLMELASVQESENGSTIIYEADITGAKIKIKAFFEKAKAWIKKWAGYVKGFFIKCFKMLEALFATDAKFVADNRKVIEGLGSEAANYKFSGFKYSLDFNYDDITSKADLFMARVPKTGLDAYYKEIESGSEDYIEAVRGTLIGEDKSTNKEFRDGLYKKFRSGESTKTETTVSSAYGSLAGIMDAISNTKKAKRQANHEYEAAKKSINKCIKEINDAQKKVESTDTDRDVLMKIANKQIEFLKRVLTIENSAHGEHIKAIKANNRQARSVAAQLIYKYAKVKKTKGLGIKEEYEFEDEENNEDHLSENTGIASTSYLDNLTF